MINESNSREIFEKLMNFIRNRPLSNEQYQQAKKYCNSLEQQAQDMTVDLGLKWEEIQKTARRLRDENSGDILPVLNYLSQFTMENDPRISDMQTKASYLSGVECFVTVTREYLLPRGE